jgi:hypothetical protein
MRRLRLAFHVLIAVGLVCVLVVGLLIWQLSMIEPAYHGALELFVAALCAIEVVAMLIRLVLRRLPALLPSSPAEQEQN